MSVTRKWSLLAAVLALAILVAGWFLLIAPKRSEASGLREQAATQQDANARLLQQLAVLKAQQAELPEQRAKLAVMRTQIPDNPALPTLIRDLTAAGRKVGVSIDTMAPSTPAAVAVAQPAPVSTGTTTASGGTASGGTAAAPVAGPALFQVPLALNVTGSYFELEQFINKLEGLKRSFLVTGFSLTPAGEGTTGSASTGGPAPGDLTLALQGRVYLAPAPAAATATQPTPAASPATGQ
ncbi:MAG TPA: type 4a pilus biogenesis protein PilO [Nocardioidaceae bacterium]|nr:type 4a pilus biogenesis protein PilO [Nocardioidaceae bacterium]